MLRLQRAQRYLLGELDKVYIATIITHTVDEGVQDGHGSVGDTSIRMNLLQD